MLQSIVDIAVDWISDKIYWTNINRIMVYDLQRGYQAIMIDSLTLEPSAMVFYQVVIDPITRYIASLQICFTH